MRDSRTRRRILQRLLRLQSGNYGDYKSLKEGLVPENRYPEVVKQAKVPYQGSFEEVACASLNNQIGIIANQIQRAIALRWECRYFQGLLEETKIEENGEKEAKDSLRETSEKVASALGVSSQNSKDNRPLAKLKIR